MYPGLFNTDPALRREQIVAAGDYESRFWDLSGNVPEALPLILDSPAGSELTYSDDGRYLLASGPGGSRLWSLDPSDLLAACATADGTKSLRQ
jgi:hypothetical protein